MDGKKTARTKRRTCCGIGCNIIGMMLFLSVASCTWFIPPAELSPVHRPLGPLKEAQRSKDSIVVDFCTIRIRFEERDLLQNLWADGSTSEQVIPIELRRRLAQEGFRIGIQGKGMSQSLARLLELDTIRKEEASGQMLERSTDVKTSQSGEFGEIKGVDAETLTLETLIQRFQYTFEPGKRWLINTYDDPLPEAAVFWNEGGFSGCTYPKAQGVLEMSAIPYPDGSGVRFDILPKLYYGDPRQTMRILNGVYLPEYTREHRTYDELKTSVKLLPGQWLFIGPTSESPPGVGRHFLTRDRGLPEQKLFVIRLAATHQDRTIREIPDEPLPFEDP